MIAKRMEFEPTVASEAHALADLRVEAMRESLERVGRFDLKRARTRFLFSFSPAQTRHILLDGERVGFYVIKPEGDELLLDHFYIRAGHQGQGLGTAVLAEIFSRADREGRSLHVGALKGSDANRFYLRHGFVLVEQEEFDNSYIRHAVKRTS